MRASEKRGFSCPLLLSKMAKYRNMAGFTMHGFQAPLANRLDGLRVQYLLQAQCSCLPSHTKHSIGALYAGLPPYFIHGPSAHSFISSLCASSQPLAAKRSTNVDACRIQRQSPTTLHDAQYMCGTCRYLAKVAGTGLWRQTRLRQLSTENHRRTEAHPTCKTRRLFHMGFLCLVLLNTRSDA